MRNVDVKNEEVVDNEVLELPGEEQESFADKVKNGFTKNKKKIAIGAAIGLGVAGVIYVLKRKAGLDTTGDCQIFNFEDYTDDIAQDIVETAVEEVVQ